MTITCACWYEFAVVDTHVHMLVCRILRKFIGTRSVLVSWVQQRLMASISSRPSIPDFQDHPLDDTTVSESHPVKDKPDQKCHEEWARDRLRYQVSARRMIRNTRGVVFRTRKRRGGGMGDEGGGRRPRSMAIRDGERERCRRRVFFD